MRLDNGSVRLGAPLGRTGEFEEVIGRFQSGYPERILLLRYRCLLGSRGTVRLFAPAGGKSDIENVRIPT